MTESRELAIKLAFARENVRCPGSSAGRTKQAFVLLSEKVLANIETALAE